VGRWETCHHVRDLTQQRRERIDERMPTQVDIRSERRGLARLAHLLLSEQVLIERAGGECRVRRQKLLSPHHRVGFSQPPQVLRQMRRCQQKPTTSHTRCYSQG
jgi:hypothetical protein